MWRTPEGERVLKGAEARLVRASLSSVVAMLEEDLDAAQWLDDEEDWPTAFGVPLFDELETAQRLVLLADVGRAMFNPRVPWSRHTAMAEAAVYVLYENIVDKIGIEIARQVKHGCELRKWRRMVLAACRQWDFDEDCDDIGGEVDAGIPDLDSTDVGRWSDEVFALADLVFWDRDWEMTDVFLDAPPDVAANVRRQVGIDDDYFVAVAPLATKRRLRTAQRTLTKIMKRKPR
ncbi:MAG TPA: hypothetical protein VG826_26050 [Pirellulales bacterium]|nr:hypothetical protein [Pirellulales bacterium]